MRFFSVDPMVWARGGEASPRFARDGSQEPVDFKGVQSIYRTTLDYQDTASPLSFSLSRDQSR